MDNRALNAVCPYFTMFPLDFPLAILSARAREGDRVLDPFSGRGTTNYAARLTGLHSVGMDSSPVAAALTQAKVAQATPDGIARCFDRILAGAPPPADVPEGEFWQWAFHPTVLETLAQLRSALMFDCRSHSRRALRAILLGALHGPLRKQGASYFSNQCTRTYAPKPRYAVTFWKKRGTPPPEVDLRRIVQARARRCYEGQPNVKGLGVLGDSRQRQTYDLSVTQPVRWIITSPPYYGMRTYIQDQWLRNWFVGGPPDVDYRHVGQLVHTGADAFAAELKTVWANVASVASPDAHLVVRYGGIWDRKADPLSILRASFKDSPWVVTTARPAGTASSGKRQALHFGAAYRVPKAEYDVWARLR